MGKKYLEGVVYMGENKGKEIDASWGTSMGEWGEEDMKEAIHVEALLVSKIVACLITAVCSVFLLNSIPNLFLVENNCVGVQRILCVCVHNVLLANFKLDYLASRRRPAAGKTRGLSWTLGEGSRSGCRVWRWS